MEQKIIRCAVYTRKSTEEGLDKEFNTLEAQREAGENYIKSQKNQGWVLIPEYYDDGGYSGGTLKRPALQRLLSDVQDGKVDMIVVYKIDRLTRSLLDFSQLIKTLDAHECSFVSVTQNFNTCDSMGKLTLNILLSFAQFEREVSAERIRDKIAATKKKGMWTGGSVPLGYDVEKKKLIINKEEAKIVRYIFEEYLRCRSEIQVSRNANEMGYHSKPRKVRNSSGEVALSFNHAMINNMLRNPIYIGKVPYKGELFDGLHEAIIPMELWNQVQELKRLNRGDRFAPSRSFKNSLLKGLVECECCGTMTPTRCKKGNKYYEYYTSLKAVKEGYKLCRTGSVAEWSHKLKIAEKNVKDLEKELKNTGGISFFKRHAPNFMLDEYEIFANDLAEILSESKYNLDEYEKKVWELAAEYPDFKPQADAIQEKLLLLKAARQDAWDARKELEYINNPELRPKKELEQHTEQLPTVDTSAYEKNIEDIKKKVFELQEPYDQAMQKATEWRDNALANLDSTKAGYEDFKADVNRVYDDMVKKASDAALKSSTNWKDGLIRSLQSSYADVTDMAKATENIVKNSFTAMEDTLTEFVMTGKASFSDFVNSIVEGMVRMAIQYAVIKPIMSGIMGYFGVPMAHTGGVIGTDTLSSRQISPDVFEGAPRYHTGGLVGDEIPIIAKRGETVFTKGQMDALGTELNSKNPVNVNVNVHNNASGTKASASANKDAQGNVSIDVIVEQIESTIGKNISKGEGLSPILEQRYALNPAFGSYR